MQKVSDLDESFYAYLAGLIDGEGYLSIIKSLDNRYKKGYWTMAVLDITNTNEDLMILLKNSLGYGRLYHQKNNSNFSKHYELKEIYHLKFYPRNLRMLLPKVIPYLIIKKEKAENILKELTIIGNN